MNNQLKSKSLNLQETVSKNPEKILSGEEQSFEDFLRELAAAREARQTIKDFILELGARRNCRLGVK